MANLFKVNEPVRKPIFEGVQGENEARSIQFDVTPWVDELGDGVVTATAKRSQDSQPYPVTVTKVGNVVTWKPTSIDTAFAGVGSFQLEYTVDSVLAKTCIWSTMVAPSLDPAGDPPDPYDNWLAEMRQIAADALQDAQDAEAWAVGQRNGADVPSTDPAYENNAKYYAGQAADTVYKAFIEKSASGAVASFNDGGDDVPVKDLKISIVPKQSGSGTPSPDNVRAITGWTGANVNVARTHTLANSFNDTSNGAEISKYLDRDGNLVNMVGYAVTEYIPVEEGDDCSITNSNINAPSMCFYDKNKTFLIGKKYNGRSPVTETAPANAEFVRFSYGSSWNAIVTVHTTTTPVPLGQTVYGGEVDVTSGEGSKNIEMVAINDISFGTSTIGGHTIFRGLNHFAISQNVAGLCECLTPTTESLANMPNNSFRFSNYWDGNARLAIRADGYADVNAIKTALGTNKIAIPVNPYGDFTITPTEVKTLLGQNNVWADTGDTAVTYRADPTLAYAELQALILENI